MSAKLMTKAHRAQLAQNGIAQRQARDRGEYIDFPPVEKFFKAMSALSVGPPLRAPRRPARETALA